MFIILFQISYFTVPLSYSISPFSCPFLFSFKFYCVPFLDWFLILLLIISPPSTLSKSFFFHLVISFWCKPINIIHHINKTKDKNHIIMSINAEKAFVKIQHPFMIKILSQVGIEGAHLNIIKAIYERPTANIILKIRNKARMPTFTTSIQYSIGSPSHRNQTRQRNKRHPYW